MRAVTRLIIKKTVNIIRQLPLWARRIKKIGKFNEIKEQIHESKRCSITLNERMNI
jgi:hypothetical protein